MGHLWRRRPGPWKAAPEDGWEAVPAELPDAVTLPPRPGGGAVVVEVRYEVRPTPGRYLPVLGQSPRYLLFPFYCRPDLPVPARPYADRMTFPVVLAPGTPAHFFATTRSLVGGRWVVTGVRVRPLPADAAGHYQETLRP